MAKGKTTPISDVDFAYLPKKDLPFDKEMKLKGGLEELFGREDLDLVNLSYADPLLAHEVISNGILLFKKSGKIRLGFEERTMREYLDTIPLRNIQEKYLHKRIMAGSFGKREI